MKIRLFFMTMVCLIIFPSQLFAINGVGVHVQGKCTNLEAIASTSHLNAVQTSLTSSLKALETAVTRAIKEQTAAMQGTQSSASEMMATANSKAIGVDNTIKTKGTSLEKMIFSGPVYPNNDPCPPMPPSYYLQRVSEDIAIANSQSAALDKNIGEGFGKDNKSDFMPILAAGAKESLEYGFPFSSNVFTDEQMSAWESTRHFLLPDIPTKQYKKMPTKQEMAQHLIDKAKVRELRVLINEPFRQYGLERMATIPAENPYKWAGGSVNKPVTVTFRSKNGQVDYENPVVKEIPANGKISKQALLELIGKRFTSADYLAQLDARDAAGVLKEQMRLDAFNYTVLLDIRNSLIYNNMMTALSVSEEYRYAMDKLERRDN